MIPRPRLPGRHFDPRTDRLYFYLPVIRPSEKQYRNYEEDTTLDSPASLADTQPSSTSS
jgi:hypothetical protein